MNVAAQGAVDQIAQGILRESPFGGVSVQSLAVVEGTGPDEQPYLRFVVSAADPDPAVGTWPVEDVFRLRYRVQELAAGSDVELPRIVVEMHPEHPDEDEGIEDQDSGLVERLDDETS